MKSEQLGMKERCTTGAFLNMRAGSADLVAVGPCTYSVSTNGEYLRMVCP